MKNDNFHDLQDAILGLFNSFWAIVFGILLGTTIVLQGEYIGIVFYVMALLSSVVLMACWKKFKKLKGEMENDEQRD